MDAYEKILKTIREESAKGEKESPFHIVQMTSSSTLSIDGMELDGDDLYFMSGLELKKDDYVLITRISDERFVVIGKVVV